MPEASVIVLTYNSAANLRACLRGLGQQTHQDFEVIVVDNASTDCSSELASSWYPDAVVVRNSVNEGYAAGCNAGFRRARGEFFAVIGPDCEPEPEWLEALVRACRNRDVGLVTSMVRHYDDRARINTCGNDVHLLGLGFCHGLGDKWQDHAHPAWVASITGCSFAMPRRVFEHIGGFDEHFFMYCEDTDLSLRAWLAGYKIAYVPGSVAYHRYYLDVQPRKFFHLERNRLLVLLKNLRWRTLVALVPSLVAGELMMWAYSALHGPAFLGAKLQAWRWLLAHRRLVHERRVQTAALRLQGDRLLLALMTARLSEPQVLGVSPVARVIGRGVNVFFAAGMAIARRIAR